MAAVDLRSPTSSACCHPEDVRIEWQAIKHLDERKSIIMPNRFQRLRYETFPINTRFVLCCDIKRQCEKIALLPLGNDLFRFMS